MKVKVRTLIKFKSGDFLYKNTYDYLKRMYNSPITSQSAKSFLHYNIKLGRMFPTKRTFTNKTNNKGE